MPNKYFCLLNIANSFQFAPTFIDEQLGIMHLGLEPTTSEKESACPNYSAITFP